MDRRQYLRHFLLLFSGTAASQLANLASYPFLARLYTPAQFGVFAMFVAASAIPAAIACGRFEQAVPTAPKHGRFAILWLTYILSGATGVASAAVAAAYWIWKGTDEALPLAALLGLVVFLTGYCNASNLFLLRHNFYRVTSSSVVARTGATVIVQVALAFFWRTPMSLVVGYCCGLVAQGLLLRVNINRRIPLRNRRLSHIRVIFRKYRRQVTVDIPSTLLAAISLNIMPFFLQFLYGPAAVGFFSLGQRVAILPLQLFNDSLSQVFFQKAARAQEERGDFWREMKFNLLTSFLLSLGVLAGIALFARPFVTAYLGQRWAPAATILLILAPMLAVRSLAMSIGTTVFVIKRVHWLFAHNVANLVMVTAAFLVAWVGRFQLFQFLAIAATLMSLEFAAFAAVLIVAAYRRRGQRAD